jgi:DNA-binding winged helix-turn-helix (wHTH) protein/TolB-like protein/tetratricopeptide (TPR) repeat protein
MDKLANAIPSQGRIDLAREPDFALGGLRVRPSRLEIVDGGARHELQPRVMQVLVALARSPNEVVSQRELIGRCWDGLSVSDDAIGRCIAQLRRLAAAWPEPPFAIETIPGVGYRLAGSRIELGLPSAARPRPIGRWGVGIVATALVATVGLWLARDQLGPPPTRVAVLPFRALTGEPETRALAQSVPDEVLSVMGANQIAPVTGGGRGGGVGFLIDGSVSRDAQQTHVNVRLEDAGSHAVLWSNEFIRANSAVSGLPIEAATRIGDITQMAIFARSSRPPLRNDGAMAAMLEAHDVIRGDRAITWARMLDLARRPSAADPNFAFGHSILATADAMAACCTGTPDRKPALLAEARTEANRALAIDPHDAAAWYALSMLLPADAYRARMAILAEGLESAAHPAPPLAALNETLGYNFMAVGRLNDGLPYLQRSEALDPLSPPKAMSLIEGYADVGQQSHAEEVIGESLRRWPSHVDIRNIRFYQVGFFGSHKAALSLLGEPDYFADKLPAPVIAGWRAYLEARLNPARAGRAVKALVDAGDLFYGDYAVMMFSDLGRPDLAFDRAERATRGIELHPWILFLPQARALRDYPRFPELARDLKLDAYWRATGRWPDVCQPPHPEPECPALRAMAQPPKA